MELRGQRVSLRPTQPADAPQLSSILQEPEVAAWWGRFDIGRVRDELIGEREDDEGFVIEHDGDVVGYIQLSEEDDPEFRHAGIDLFLRTDVQGQGLGPDAIRTLAAYLIDVRGHHRLTIDPAADNVHAIAAYTKVGFRPVGRLRAYQRMPDGRWIDGWLMELLADELVR